MMGNSGGCLKRFLLFIFALYLIFSIGVIGLGAWLKLKQGDNAALFGTNSVVIAGIAMIVVGILLFFISVLGFCGLIHRGSCVLKVFVAFLFLILLVLVAAGTTVAVFTRRGSGSEVNTVLEEQMLDTFHAHYGSDKHLTSLWDNMQSTYNCCGVAQARDYQSSEWFHTRPTSSNENGGGSENGNPPFVPHSCCWRNRTTVNELADDLEKCAKEDPAHKPIFIFQQGCMAFVRPKIQQGTMWAMIIVFILSGLVLFGAILTIALLHTGVREPYVV